MTITDIAFGGDGVGKVDGMTVFVPFVAEGEKIEVVITRAHKRYARGECLRVLNASPDRVEPVCPVYAQCAGCQYQHIDYAEQARVKTQQVRSLLARIGHWPDAPVRSIVPAPSPWGYRNRITLHGPGAPAYIARDNQTRVPVWSCPLAAPDINDQLARWIEDHADGLLEGESLTLHAGGGGQANDGAWMTRTVQGVPFRFPRGSFFQVHAAMAERLVGDVLEAVADAGAETLIDAYSGVGVFGLLAAPGMQQVWCIESDRSAARAARFNMAQLGVSNANGLAGRVEDHLPQVWRKAKGKEMVLVLDPPRMGCSRAVLECVVKARVQRICYVSCAPDRLARDARFLLDHGYVGTWIQPYDMFPQTAHVEVLACFDRS